ncbi:MAG: PP2C family protein-serine/threonine phosphatase [Planctomycetota bacterium]
MHSRSNILIAALNDCDRSATELLERLTAAWIFENPPLLRLSDVEDLEPDVVQNADAIVLLARHDTEQMRVLPLLAMLEEAGVPVMAILDEPGAQNNPFEYGGALVQPADTEDALLCATLHGMLFRQREVLQLRKDVALARRFQGGLKGEIARMQEELQLAAMVQREFLPRKIPSVLGVRFAAMWRPANFVSGDIYDIVRLDEDHVGVFLADAVGHGVPAALMTMVICRSLITKETHESSYRVVPPAEVLGRLNSDLIRRQGRTTRFATAVYGVVDCRSRTMRIACAGHPPPILLKADGSVHEVETSGGLLGVFVDEAFEETTIELDVDDRILLYSDGFEQAFPTTAGDPYARRLPTTRYRDEFSQLAEVLSAQVIVDSIAHRLNDQSGSLHQIDDLTLVCMHAGPLGAGATPGRADRAEPAPSPVTPSAPRSA